MRAWILHGINDLRYEETDKPVPARHEALIAVKAVGICGSDIPRIYQTGAHTHPLILGHEFSGVVEAVGADVDRDWLGRRVGIFPLIPCRDCPPCQKKQYEMCRHYSYLGSRQNGGFAEYAAVPADSLIPLPDSVSFEEAAMLEPMAVAVHALRRAQPDPADTIAVCGLGTIGSLLTMFLREIGIRNILTIGNKSSQQQTILDIGLPKTSYCNTKEQDVDQWIDARTQGQGVDIFFECVGKNETLIQAIDHTAPAGRVLLLGNPYSQMHLDRQVYWKILRHQLTVTGTWNSTFTHSPDDDWHYVLDRLSSRRIDPARLISHRFPLDALDEGLLIMRDKTEDHCKIMLENIKS